MTHNLRNRFYLLTACALAILVTAGCATQPRQLPANALPFKEAISIATDNLIGQTQQLPAFIAKIEAKLNKRVIVIDPLIEKASGQQTALTQQAEQRIVDDIRSKYPQFEILPFQATNIDKAQYVLTGIFERSNEASAQKQFRIILALTEIKGGKVLAQTSVLARDDNLDWNPTAYYRDSPVLIRDKIVDGYIRTTEAAPGSPADRTYMERVATSTLINEATIAYNGERIPEALGLYKTALKSPGGEQLRVLNGLYLTNWKLGRVSEAEQSFSRIVASGLANNSLGIKFLFNPGSTEFWSDTKISGPYKVWLRQIARQTATAKVCMNIVGHTSRTGSEQFNEQLSQSRAAGIKQKLEVEAPELRTRTKALGKGFHENIVGTGTDDARDALDRRVEFKIVACAQSS